MATDTKLVFIPLPIISHLVSAIQTAKLLVDRDPNLSITVILLKLPMDTKTNDSINNSLGSRIDFVELSQASPELVQDTSKSGRMFIHNLVEGQKDSVRAVVAELMKNKEKIRVAGFVLDMFCAGMIDVANELGIRSFIYFPSGASPLGLFFHIQSLVDQKMMEVKEWLGSLGDELCVPTYVHPVPVRVLPSSIYEHGDAFLSVPRRLRETKGILINTFCELEHHAISALEDDQGVPSVYPIGPVIQIPGEERKRTQDDIMEWLDCQPTSSVVFLCFGSNGSFEGDQVKEIALALEHTAHRFLWSLRKPPPKEKMEFPGEFDDPKEVLPEGFLQRTKSIGKVIGWAPQLAVLSHPATGGFVSHCGWNSTLESVLCGVPMAAWPMAAEQQSNAFQLVKELGIAVEIQMDYRRNSDAIVGAKKIGNAIRILMDPDNEIREKVKVMQRKSKAADIEGGSYYDALGCFLRDINH